MFKKISSKQHTHGNSGFTLVELVVSMTLTAIFATAIVAVLPAATRIFMQMEDMSRAQVVADMVVDALREECADTYIEDFASVRIVDISPTTDGDTALLNKFIAEVNNKDITEADDIDLGSSGNILVIRKTNGYCEAIYSDIAIASSDYWAIQTADEKAGTYKFDPDYILSRSSRAVYRLFDTAGNSSAETLQGYVHYGYYPCTTKRLYCNPGDDNSIVYCAFPRDRYDYTNPFTIDAYNGYTISLEFSDLKTTTGNSTTDFYNQRPSSVVVTVKVYKCSYNDQSDNNAIYTRSALLVFAEDTTK